jgi:hypothetical protein
MPIRGGAAENGGTATAGYLSKAEFVFYLKPQVRKAAEYTKRIASLPY